MATNGTIEELQEEKAVLAGVMGFLVGLLAVAAALIAWLFYDRRQKQREIYRLTMVSIGFSHDGINNIMAAMTPEHEQNGVTSDGSATSPICPVRSLIPAIARYHSRQLSATEEGSVNKPLPARPTARAQSMDALMSARLNPPPVLDDYATIRCVDDNRVSKISEVPIPQRTSQGTCEIVTNGEAANDLKPETDADLPKERRDSEVKAVAENECIVRPKEAILRKKPKRLLEVNNEQRYSLVRMGRYEKSPTGSAIDKTPRVSCNLLDEISNETDIRFSSEKKRRKKSDRKSSGSAEMRNSSGVYEDIEPPLSPLKKVSITSDDLTEISDLDTTSSESDVNDDDVIEPENRDAVARVIPDVIVTPPSSDNDVTRGSIVTSSHVHVPDGDWLGFESEDTLLI